MQGYRVLEETLLYRAGNNCCEVYEHLQGHQAKLLVDFSEPLGGSGQLRRRGNERQSVWVIRQGTRIAIVYRDRLEVMGFVLQEDDAVEYDLSPATVRAIASAIEALNVSACEIVST